MKVTLIASTYLVDHESVFTDSPFADRCGDNYDHDADRLAETAGRLCYRSWDLSNKNTRDNDTYLANILKQQHYSVLEHASATFLLQEVSRSFTHELVRHRHLSFSQVSQRYVEPEQFDWVCPPALRGTQYEIALGATYFAAVRQAKTISLDLQRQGYSKKQANEAARAFLPNCAGTEIVVTGNLRAWRELLQKRLSPGADAEFQEVAAAILAELKREAPNTFADFE
jgi:thymidylate synthase (FAD)